MNMFEEAKSLDVMMKMRSLSQNETAKMLGVSQSYVANKLRLLKLGETVRNKVVSNRLCERHARALLRLSGEEEQLNALEIICSRGLSVKETEALIDLISISSPSALPGRADMLKAVNLFLDYIKKSVSTISSLGAYADSKITHEGRKTYISIIIDETPF